MRNILYVSLIKTNVLNGNSARENQLLHHLRMKNENVVILRLFEGKFYDLEGNFLASKVWIKLIWKFYYYLNTVLIRLGVRNNFLIFKYKVSIKLNVDRSLLLYPVALGCFNFSGHTYVDLNDVLIERNRIFTQNWISYSLQTFTRLITGSTLISISNRDREFYRMFGFESMRLPFIVFDCKKSIRDGTVVYFGEILPERDWRQCENRKRHDWLGWDEVMSRASVAKIVNPQSSGVKTKILECLMRGIIVETDVIGSDDWYNEVFRGQLRFEQWTSAEISEVDIEKNISNYRKMVVADFGRLWK